MRTFDSLGEFGMHLLETEVAVQEMLELGLERAAVLIERTAKAEIGHYQPQTGPFPAWPELADSTKERRVQAGYSENDPLLASGELLQSIGHSREGLVAVVGSTDELMVFHEFGTSKMPARPVLGPAAFTNKEAIQKLVGAAVVAGLVGAEQVHAALGYDFTTKD